MSNASSRMPLSLILLLAFSFLLSLTECASAFQAKNDRSFREFGKDLVPTPTELSEHLALLRLKKEPMSDFNDAMREQLEKAGSELFNQLDEEQREKAQAIARNLLSGDPSKAQEANELYNMFGADDKKKIKDLLNNIPPGVREHFENKYKNYQKNQNNSRQFDAMRSLELMKNQEGADARDASTDRDTNRTGTAGGNESRRDSRSDSSMDSLDKNQGNKNKDGFQQRTGSRDSLGSGGDASGAEGDGENGTEENRFGAGNGDVDSLLESANGAPDLEKLKALIDQQAKAKKQLRSREGQLSASELARQQKKLAERMAQMQRMKERLNKRENGELDDELADLFNFDSDAEEKQGSQRSDPVVNRSSDKKNSSNSILKEVDSKEEAVGTIGDLVERATKKGLEKSFARSDKDESSSTWDRLFKKKEVSKRKSGPKERLETRFDRATVKVAKTLVESLEKKKAAKNGSAVDESVGSVFESLIDRVQKTIKNNKSKSSQVSKRRSGLGRNGNRSRDQSQGNDTAANSQRAATRNNRSSVGGDSGGGMFDSLDKTLESTKQSIQQADLNMELPAFSNMNWKGVLMAVGSIALLVMLALILWQNVGPEPTDRQRRRRKSKPITKIRSPKDLVEAFDGFLLDTFGYRSDWWNANHAAKVIIDQAPGYEGKVDELVDDYVAARYAPATAKVADASKDHLSTLKELATKEFSVDDRVDTSQIIPAES